MIGETIKDFTITAQLGRGGMGEVFVAEQRIVKTKVAIKMLQPQISAEKAHVDRFFNEAIAVSKIKHAGIVKIFDVGFHEGRAYLVMEFLEGETLSSRLRAGAPFAAAIQIARQVTSILDATHAAGIIHRDLKPDNIFIVADAELGERVKILDFGIAKLGDVQATAASTSMGTPAYMPPELWRDAATSGPATDVYALGCVLFELCCGRPPFIVTAVSDACGRHLTEIPPRVRSLRPELPAGLDYLIATMLEKEQAVRPTTKAIASALAAIQTTGIAPSAPQAWAMAPTAPSGPGTPPTAVGHDSGTPMSPDAAKLEAEGKWMELIKLLRKQTDTASNDAEHVAIYYKIATIYQDRFANLAEAIKAYEMVLAIDPGHRKANEALRAMYEKRRDWEKLLELEKVELGRTPPEKRADKAVDVARLAAARVSKPDIQLYWWERVLEHEPDHRQAFTELSKLYEHAERWTELSELLRRHAESTPGNDDRASALRKLAAVHGVALDDRASALEALERVVQLDPHDKVAKQTLVDLRAAKPVAWSTLGEGYRISAARPAVPPPESSPRADAATPTPPIAKASLAKPEAPDTRGSRDVPGKLGGGSPEGVANKVSNVPGLGNVARPGSATDSPAKKSPAKLIAIGAVVALAGGGIFVATRGSSKRADTGSSSGSATTQSKPHGSQVEADIGSQRVDIGSQRVDTGSHAAQKTGSQADGSGPTQPGTQAEASGLVLSYRVLSKPALPSGVGGGDFRVIAPGDKLHTDDRLVFEVMVSEQAHVFVSQRPKGKPISVLFPNPGIDITNPLPAKTWTRIPSGTRSFRINDKDVGIETLYFIAARTPPPNLAAAIANEGKPGAKPNAVEDQIVAVAMEKRDDCKERGREVVLDSEDPCKANTRGVELDDEPPAKGAQQARRVRGMTMEDIVFVPFRFEHAAANGLSKEQIEEALSLHNEKVFDCIKSPGTFVIDLEIDGPTGTVRVVRIASKQQGAARACLDRLFRTVKFPTAAKPSRSQHVIEVN